MKAMSHFSVPMLKQLARIVRFEQHEYSGHVLFRQGDPGTSWFIIIRGEVDVAVADKVLLLKVSYFIGIFQGIVCSLVEGDDFGKMALVSDSARSATVTLRDDDSQFIRVDKQDFKR